MKGRQTRVVFLWHMHQPSYKSPISGEYVLPWVVLHAMRDYYDMPALSARFDGVKATFNLVPGLLLQVADYAGGRARDVFLDVALRDPGELSGEEKEFLLDNFFAGPAETMVRPYPRYAELADKARTYGMGDSAVARFSEQELLDLQVWFFLAWTGAELRRDERVSGLLAKGRDFTQEDKRVFQGAVVEFLNRVVPLYRDLGAAKRIEVACSPMYHPILPLLADTSSAREARPDIRLPGGQFVFPEDAADQVARGRALVSRLVEQPVVGMWPSEGSLSTEVVRILGQSDVRWVATDEKLLWASRPDVAARRVDALHTPWQCGKVAVFFRDTQLSDLIGFVYARWDPQAAVRHFIQELAASVEQSSHSSPVVTIAMDGENAWEHYLHGGMRFLELLYSELAKDRRFRVVSPADVLSEARELPRLERLAAGSWIGGDFTTWIGDPVKNVAWEHLLSARNAVASVLSKGTLEEEEREELWDLVLRAEASDWFWWFGEGHSSKYDAEFDLLFRHHLKAIYSRLGMYPPEELDSPLDDYAGEGSRVEEPVHLISPAVTGRHDNYYKWLSAGRVVAAQGILHRPSCVVRELLFGFDRERLYFRLEVAGSMRELLADRKVQVVLHFSEPVHRDLCLRSVAGRVEAVCQPGGEACEAVEVAAESVLEVAIPFKLFGRGAGKVGPGAILEVYVVLLRKGTEIERFPQAESIVFRVRGEDLDAENWHV